MPRFGMNVRLVHPPGFRVMPDILEEAKENARRARVGFDEIDDFDAAVEGTDAVYANGCGQSLTTGDEQQGKGLIDRYTDCTADGETCWHIAAMIRDGWDVTIPHGNGPQVGFILRRSELAAHELHEVPLDACGADTQGAIGYALQQNLYNDFARLGMDKHAVT